MILPAVDPHAALPLHAQVQAIVRRLLDKPPYRDGGVLPDEITLAERLKVGRGTVRQAIGALVTEGLLERKRGVGTRRAPAPISGDLAAFRSFSREMANAGVAVRLIAATLTREAAPTSIAEALGVASGTALLRLVRVRGDDHGPIAAFASWFAPGVDLRQRDDLARPLYDLIGSRGGPQPVSSTEALLAVAADETVARLLDCPVGTPLLERRRQVRAADGRCFEAALVHYRSDRFHLHLNLGATEA
jgi:GntR family transcriptional regulator